MRLASGSLDTRRGHEMKKTDDPLLVSYRELRRGVGLIGIGLPIALPLLGWIVLGEGVRDSISSYYWAAAGNGILVGSVFVGALCSIGVFLWSYRGDGKWDNRAGNLACIAAVSVALFPCSPAGGPEIATRWVHFSAASVLFLLLAYFCFFSFTGQDPGTTPTDKKPLRNNIYRTCGIMILSCIASIATMHAVWNGRPPGSSVFWLEAVAIWAFGWSWYIKGKGLSPVQDNSAKDT